MKNLVLFILCACTVSLFAQKVPNIAVSPFVGDETVSSQQLNFITGKFAGELINTQAFTVLDRGKMEYILKEQGIQQSGACNTSECRVQMGQLLGVNYIIAGNLVRFGRKYAFRADYIDVGSGEVLYFVEQSETGELEDVYESLCRGAAIKLAQKVKGEESNQATPVEPAIAPASTLESTPMPVMASTPPAAQVPADAIPVSPSKKPMSTKRKIALALWGASLVGTGFGVYSNTQVTKYQSDYDAAIEASVYADAQSAHDNVGSAVTRRNISYGVSLGTLLVGAVLWFLPEGK